MNRLIMPTATRPLLVSIALLVVCVLPAHAQFAITTTTGSTAQSFDGLANTGAGVTWTNDTTVAPGDSTLEGWSLFQYTNTPIATYSAGTGSTGTGNFYSFGAASISERALGGVSSANTYFGTPTPASGAVAGYIAFAATNNSGGALATITLGFDGEQWRNGGNASAHTMVFEYGIGSSFSTVSWILAGGNFNWASPIVGTTAGAVDGNTAGLVANRGGTINSLSWNNGDTLWLRWIERNDAGNDHGLAIDNVSFSWATGTPPKNLTWAPISGNWDTTTINWVDGVTPTVFTAGDAVNFTDSGLAQSTVTVAAGGVAPGLVTVGNTVGTYTVTGGAITSNQALVKTGAGALVMGTSISQGLNAQAGSVQTSVSEVFGNTSVVTLGDAVTFNLNNNSETVGSLNLTGATITTGTGLLTVNGGATIAASPTSVTTSISGKYSTGATGTTRTFSLTDGGATVDLDLDANLEGAVRFSLAGTGTVRIGGDNSAHTGGLQMASTLTYNIDTTKAFGTGTLFLNGGTINAVVPLTGADKIAVAISLGGPVQFQGEDVELGGALTFFGGAGVGGAKFLTVAGDQTVTLSGTITGTGAVSSIIKDGLGTLVLKADASAYSGEFVVGAGKAIAETAGSLGSGAVRVAALVSGDPASLEIQASQTLTSLTIGDGATVTLTASPAFSSFGAAVPEPGSIALLALGALGLLGRRRRVG